MLLITGASGTMGAAVMAEIRKRQTPFRAMYRSAEDAGRAPSGIPTVIADFAQHDSMLRALDGVSSVFLVCSPIPSLVELESAAIQACRDSGVKYIVLNSALGAADYPKSFPSWHRKVEERLANSSVPHTILRPNSFMQNILAYLAPSIRTQSAFYSAMGNARTSYLDARDIAAVVANIMSSPTQHLGQIYELNGPEAVTYAELASRISRVARRPVQFVDIPEAAQRQSMLELGMPQWQVDALLDLQRYYTNGQGGEVTDVLPRLLGRPPIALDSFLEEFQEQFGQEQTSQQVVG